MQTESVVINHLKANIMATKISKTNVVTEPQVEIGGKDFLTVPETCAFLGIKRNYLYKLTASKKLPYYRPCGRKVLFKKSELQALVEMSRVSTDDELKSRAETELMKKGGLK